MTGYKATLMINFSSRLEIGLQTGQLELLGSSNTE